MESASLRPLALSACLLLCSCSGQVLNLSEDDPWKPYERLIEKASSKAELDPSMVLAILRAENSTANPLARSSSGAIGCAQFMPKTWKWLMKEYGLEWNIYSCRDSILGAVAYMKYLEGRCMSRKVSRGRELWDCIIVSYNAGEGRVRGWIKRAGSFSWSAVKAMLPLAVVTYRDQIWSSK